MPRPKGSKNIPNGYHALIIFTPEQKEWLKANTTELISINQLVRTALDNYIDQVLLAESIDFRELFK